MSDIKKPVLVFEKLPPRLGITPNIIFGIIDISGIQKYIFGDMKASSTSADIQLRSAYVEALSHKIHEMLRSRFGVGYLFGTASSGKVQCAFSPFLSQKKLERFCESLQRTVFASTGGKLTFYYSFCKACCIGSSKYDPSKMVPVHAVAAKGLEKQKYHCTNLLLTQMDAEFCKCLSPSELMGPSSFGERELSGALAAVKMDLDNLGLFFRNIPEFDKRHSISVALNNTIRDCIGGDKRIVLLFAGGDDIFFLCKAEEYMSVVVDFYARLKSAICKTKELSDYGKKGHFGISAGTLHILSEHGKVPVFIYSEKAEQKLHFAKTKGQKNCICIEDSIIGWQNLALLERVYTKYRKKLFLGTEEDLPFLFDVEMLRERILKFARFNKNALTREEAEAIAAVEIKLL